MKPSVDYSLYLVTDRGQAGQRSMGDIIKKAAAGGVTLVQLREKSGDSGLLYERAVEALKAAHSCHIPLLIDDRVDIMLASGADGVHVGQSDLPASIVRKLIGPDKIMGVSARTVEEAIKAEQDGADYLGVGAMFATKTKTDARLVSMEELAAIRRSVSIPIVVIGGINQDTIPEFKGTGIRGFSVVSAIMKSQDTEGACRQLKQLAEETLA